MIDFSKIDRERIDKRLYKLLVVDDSPMNLDLLIDILQNDYEIQVATNGFDALNQVVVDKPDLVLLDIILPDINGYEVCRRIKSFSNMKDIPVMFISSKDSIDAQLEGFNVGGVDYILKPFNRKIINARIKTHLELKRLRDYFKILAGLDGLTQIPNRRFFMDNFSKTWIKALEYQYLIVVGMLDIDNFKKYNDNYKHINGDECLKLIARTLYEISVKNRIEIARYGGEEFIFFSDNKSLQEVVKIGNTMLKEIRNLSITHKYNGNNKVVTASIGIASQIPRNNDFNNIIKIADERLYDAKLAGKNQLKY